MTEIDLPDLGLAVWPVGCGDSVTAVAGPESVLQIDLHHCASAEDENDPKAPIIDELVEFLPKRNGRPYLAALAATHLDTDHIRGYAKLRELADIGEIWFTPRTFRDLDSDELCSDGLAFAEEARDRIEAIIESGGHAESGTRVRIIGGADLMSEPPYSDLPAELFSMPGDIVTALDGVDLSGTFQAYIHAPEDDDGSRERNDLSLGIQVTLSQGGETLNGLLLGDLSYPEVNAIFERSEPEFVEWNLFLAPHQGSKRVMYWPPENEKLQRDVLERIEAAAAPSQAVIVISADRIPERSSPGNNPPHARAANRYREIAPDGLVCTGQHPDAENPRPVIFELDGGSVSLREATLIAKSSANLATILEDIEAADPVPTATVGFGAQCRDC